MNIENFILLCLGFIAWIGIVAWYLLRQRNQREWIAHAYYGAGRIALGKMSRQRALQLVAKTMGTVTFVDDERGFIFYKAYSGDQR